MQFIKQQEPQNPLNYFGNSLVVEELTGGKFCSYVKGLYRKSQTGFNNYVIAKSIGFSVSEAINSLTERANEYFYCYSGEGWADYYKRNDIIFLRISEKDIQEYTRERIKRKRLFLVAFLSLIFGFMFYFLLK